MSQILPEVPELPDLISLGSTSLLVLLLSPSSENEKLKNSEKIEFCNCAILLNVWDLTRFEIRALNKNVLLRMCSAQPKISNVFA